MNYDSSFELFVMVCEAAVPYALIWRIGVWMVNTLLDWVTGRSDSL